MTNRFSVHSKFKIIYPKDKELVEEKIKIAASAERFARIHMLQVKEVWWNIIW
jgi:hypothetical protein